MGLAYSTSDSAMAIGLGKMKSETLNSEQIACQTTSSEP